MLNAQTILLDLRARRLEDRAIDGASSDATRYEPLAERPSSQTTYHAVSLMIEWLMQVVAVAWIGATLISLLKLLDGVGTAPATGRDQDPPWPVRRRLGADRTIRSRARAHRGNARLIGWPAPVGGRAGNSLTRAMREQSPRSSNQR